MRRFTQASLIFAASTALCAAAPQSFEVASIKPADPNARGSSSNSDRGFLTIKNWNLRRMVQRAFNVESYQITGGPPWLDSYRFNISAKIPESDATLPAKERVQLMQTMLLDLLKERFGFESHTENRILPIYNLVEAKGGIKLKAVAPTGNESVNNRDGRVECKGVSMAAFAVFLAGQMERPVHDLTLVPGVFDFKLEWTPDENPRWKP